MKVGLSLNIDCERVGYHRAPASYRFTSQGCYPIIVQMKRSHFACKHELDQRGLI